MITYRQVDSSYFDKYDSIPMLVSVESTLELTPIAGGLGGISLKEVPTEPYMKDLGKYEVASEYQDEFDISNWAFFMAFDGELPVGAVSIATRTPNVNMLDHRDDLAVLWDIRVDTRYKYRGIGTQLFNHAKAWSQSQGLKQMKIECQNNNVPACRFYQKQGATLGRIDAYAYYDDPDTCNEVQLIWYLDI